MSRTPDPFRKTFGRALLVGAAVVLLASAAPVFAQDDQPEALPAPAWCQSAAPEASPDSLSLSMVFVPSFMDPERTYGRLNGSFALRSRGCLDRLLLCCLD